jgi:hypothetical protein
MDHMDMELSRKHQNEWSEFEVKKLEEWEYRIKLEEAIDAVFITEKQNWERIWIEKEKELRYKQECEIHASKDWN